jgi:tight adherence protein B
VNGPAWFAVLGLVGAGAVVALPRRRPGRRRFVGISRSAMRRLVEGLTAVVARLPRRRTSAVAAAAFGVAALPLTGPVGALIVGTYAGLAVRGLLRRRAVRAYRQERAMALDALCALAADLRAGVPPAAVRAGRLTGERASAAAGTVSSGSALGHLAGGSPAVRRLDDLARSAWRLAERTGAPLADLIERVEADARAMDRTALAATAQAAGARATAWLLAGLPLGGIALGYGIGVDPLQVLLHTPIGASCAAAAVLLQVVGLMWADRLIDVTGRMA